MNYEQYKERYALDITYEFSRKGVCDERCKRLYLYLNGHKMPKLLIRRPEDPVAGYDFQGLIDEITITGADKLFFYFNKVNEDEGRTGFLEQPFMIRLIEDCLQNIIDDMVEDMKTECQYWNGNYIGDKRIVFNSSLNKYEVEE